ncbi:MAG: urease accessory protein UreF [Pseudomonadota bacterium]
MATGARMGMTTGTITAIPTTTAMTTPTDLSHIQTLQSWLSPAFPVGAFAWSHGLETAIVDDRIASVAALEEWLTTLLKHGSLRNDAVLLRLAHTGEDMADLAIALAASKERHDETQEQGAAFVRTVNALYGWELPPCPYPVAIGLAAARADIPVGLAMPLYLQATCSTLISVGVRLIPLGQTEGQQLLAKLHPLCADVSRSLAEATEADLGSISVLADIAAMQHETLPTRIFRS